MDRSGDDRASGLLPRDASGSEVLALVRRWCERLAAGDFEGSFELVRGGGTWTPELVQTVIAGYGSVEPFPDGQVFRVTSPASAQGGPTPHHAVDWFDRHRPDGAAGTVWFDLPLNGEWSDLTALLDVHAVEGGLELVLVDLHVM